MLPHIPAAARVPWIEARNESLLDMPLRPRPARAEASWDRREETCWRRFVMPRPLECQGLFDQPRQPLVPRARLEGFRKLLAEIETDCAPPRPRLAVEHTLFVPLEQGRQQIRSRLRSHVGFRFYYGAYDDVVPTARGGKSTAANLRLRCYTRNQLSARSERSAASICRLRRPARRPRLAVALRNLTRDASANGCASSTPTGVIEGRRGGRRFDWNAFASSSADALFDSNVLQAELRSLICKTTCKSHLKAHLFLDSQIRAS
jgi:hypothetical protein